MTGVATLSTAPAAVPPVIAPAGVDAGARARFVSLDVFRGLTILFMILVNSPGPGARPFAPLLHADWIGLTPTDLVFPSFLFAVGIAMGFAGRRGLPAGAYLRSVGLRALAIFLIGVLLNWFPFVTHHDDDGWSIRHLATLRIPGVLQRIALCYLLAAVATRWLGVRGLVLLAAALPIVHWLILWGASAPGLAFNRAGNAGTLLDLHVFGAGHLYKQEGHFDPEGLLGVLPATVNVLAGALAGRWLGARGAAGAVRGYALAGIALGVAACVVAPWLPVSKKLWTGSFVLATAGADLLALALLVWAIERRGWRAGVRFLQIPGRNPLALYILSETLLPLFGLVHVGEDGGLYEAAGGLFQAALPGPWGSLAQAIAFTLLCWSAGWWMDRRGLVLRL